MKLPPFWRISFLTITRLALLLLLIGVPSTLIFLQTVGFGETLKQRIELALSGNGFRTHIGALSLDPFQGLIAKNVVLSPTNGTRQIVNVKRLSFSINIAQLLFGRASVDEVRLHNASLNIPLSGDAGHYLPIRNASAEIFLQPGRLKLSKAKFTFENIRFSVSGSFLNPQILNSYPQQSFEQKKSQVQMVWRLMEELGKIRYLGKQAYAEVVLEGDFSMPETFQASKIVLHAQELQYRSIFLRQLEFRARYAQGILEIQKLRMQDLEGELTASGMADFGASKGQLAMNSSLNLKPILTEFISASQIQSLQKLSIESPPKIDLTADVSWKGGKLQYKTIGFAALHSFFYGKAFFRQLELKFSAENRQWFIRNLLLQTRSGTLNADVLKTPDKFQIKLDSTLNPKDFSGFFDSKTREVFNPMDILDPPRITLQLSGPKPDFASLSGRGELSLGRTAIRGAWIDFARSKIEIANQAVTFRDFVLGRGEGRGSGTFTYDFGQKQVRLKNIVSTMIPRDVMLWIDPRIAQTISVYKFHAPPNVKVEGLVHLTNPHRNALSIRVDSQAGLDYDLLRRTLHFRQTKADVFVEGTQVKVQIPSAKTFQGSVALSANVSIDPKNPVLKVNIAAARIDFASLTKLYFNYDDSKGFLSGDFNFQARLGKEEDMIGGGSIRIEDGNVLSIPFLGPISIILNEIIPGAGYEPAKKAAANFRVENRKVLIKNLQVLGFGFSLFGYGDIEFLTGKMNMIVRINAQGVPGIVLFPVSKLLEYESTGTVSKPDWRLKPFMKFKVW